MNKYNNIEVVEAVCPCCKKTFYYEEDDERAECEECEANAYDMEAFPQDYEKTDDD